MVAVGTGDLDYLSAFEVSLEISNFSLVVWSWRHSISRDIEDYSADNPRMRVEYLDNIKSIITFKEIIHKKPATYQRVTCDIKVEARISVEQLNNEIECLTKWPVQFCSRSSKLSSTQSLETGEEVTVIFLDVDNKEFNPEQFIEKYRNCIVTSKGLKAKTGPKPQATW